MQAGERRIGLRQGRIQHGIGQQQAVESLLELHLGLEHRGVAGQRPQLPVGELHSQRLHGVARNPVAEAHRGRQHGLDLVRTESQLALLRVVHHPALVLAGQDLEAPAIADEPLVLLQQADGKIGRASCRERV